MIRALRRLGLGLGILLLLGGGLVLIGGPGRFPALLAMLGVGPVGGRFTLTDARTGATVTEASYRGRWMLVYFGYTFCPDICPTDLQTMVAALGSLGAAAAPITPIFVTVDPERDRATPLARYVGLFSPRLVGLTGTQAQIDVITRDYKVFVQKLPPASPGAPYLVNHSAFIYLMNPEGKLAATFPADIQVADLAHRLLTDTAPRSAGA